MIGLIPTLEYSRTVFACDPQKKAQDNFILALTVSVMTVMICYVGYWQELTARCEFARKHANAVNKFEAQRKIEQMESALEAKQLNPDQLSLVQKIMNSAQPSANPNKPSRRKSLVGGIAKEIGGRRGSISSANALQQLHINPERITIVKQNIGRGAYGDVHQASFNGVHVAVKQLNTIDVEKMRAFRD